MKIYLLVVWGDIDPELIECKDVGERDRKAKELKGEHGDDNGMFMLSIDRKGNARVGAYSGGFFEN